MARRRSSRAALFILLAAGLAGCGGGGGSSSSAPPPSPPPPPPPPTFTIGGSVAGLAGTLVLQNNGSDSLTVSAAGSFTFATRANSGAAYAVTVLTQPAGQHCAVSSGSGTASANVTDVAITCNPLARIAFFRPSSNPNTGSNPFDVCAVSEDGTGGEITLAQQAIYEGTIGNRVVVGRGLGPNNQEISTVEADGSNTRILASGGAFFFLGTTSDRVIYQERVAAQQEDIWASLPDGSQAFALADTTDREFFHGTTAAGRVIYTRQVAPLNRDILSIDADGTSRVVLAATAQNETVSTVTADGRVVFSRENDTYIVNADGSNTARLLGAGLAFRAFLPDGRVVLSTRSANRDLHLVNSDGTGSRPLVVGPPAKEFEGVTSDGRVVFQRDLGTPQQPNFNLYSVSDAGVEATLAEGPRNEFLKAIGPAGRVVYSDGEGGEQTDVYSVNSDGSDTVALANSPDSEDFEGIADGGQVFYGKFSDARQVDLHVVNVDGTGDVRLSSKPGRSVFEAVTGSGRVIYHVVSSTTSPSPGSPGTMYSVFLDGSGDTELAGPDIGFLDLF